MTWPAPIPAQCGLRGCEQIDIDAGKATAAECDVELVRRARHRGNGDRPHADVLTERRRQSVLQFVERHLVINGHHVVGLEADRRQESLESRIQIGEQVLLARHRGGQQRVLLVIVDRDQDPVARQVEVHHEGRVGGRRELVAGGAHERPELDRKGGRAIDVVAGQPQA